MKRFGVFFLLLGAACQPPAPKPSPGTERASLVAETGRPRTYFVHGPADAGAQRRPLVIVLHGRLGSGIQIEQDTNFTAAAEHAGFVVAYPDGIDRAWHDRRDIGRAVRVDDVGFISTMIDELIVAQNVDPHRVYVAGVSNGAMMTFRLACELSEKIAGVGAVIGTLPENGAADCRPKHPMPLVLFAGTQDPFVPYAGGAVAGGRGRVLGAEATRERFAALNGCGPVDATQTYDRVPDDTNVVMTAHTHCAGDAEVRLYSIAGGGHTWPNGPQELPKGMAGRVTREIDGAAEILRFFAQH